MRERTRGYTHTAPLGLRILHHQILLKSAQSVSSAIIRDSEENINMLPLQGLGSLLEHAAINMLKKHPSK